MAHSEWCGRNCSECEKVCGLDMSMPCSPDCELLGPDGVPVDPQKCREAGCDAWEEE